MSTLICFSQSNPSDFNQNRHSQQEEHPLTLDYQLGSLSAKWESGNRGPATIATSIHDPGGTSYGTYQISTKHGYIADFLKYEGEQFCDFFRDYEPGSPEFNDRWIKIALEKPKSFHQAEHNFIKRTHYIPFMKRLENQINFSVSEYSPVMQDVIWSTAVQHGPNSQIIFNALRLLNTSQLSESDIIKKIYAERARMIGDKLYYFPRIKDSWKTHLLTRFQEEQQEALSQLAKFKLKEPITSVAETTPIPDKKTQTVIPSQDQRYRILLLTLDFPDYDFDDLKASTVYSEWDEGIGFYNYYVGKFLNKQVADQLLSMLKSKGYQIGEIVKHQ